MSRVDAMQEPTMETVNLSRRSLLQTIAGIVATAITPLSWTDVAHAMDAASAAGQAGAGAKLSFLTAAEAADIDAVTAQIVPTNDSPGAREAGVVYFIDRALATFYSQLAADYRAQLGSFQAAFRERHPAVRSFASLTSAQQIEYLQGIDQTPFFAQTRLFTLLGMFALPEYGGNPDGAGWRLIGFEDRHVFRPPFGYYDRDYPGFVVNPVKNK
jgi:Gluconate 2-dehydrogenase subunit 3